MQKINIILEKISHDLNQIESIPYKSFKLYAHEADSSSIRLFSLEQRTAVLHLAQRLSQTEISEINEVRVNAVMSNRNIWNDFNSLMTTITELTVMLYIIYFYQNK